MGYKNIHEHKRDITIPLIIHYYLLRAFKKTTQIFSTKSKRLFFRTVIRGVGIMQYVMRAKPCVHRFNYSRQFRREVPRQGCGHS